MPSTHGLIMSFLFFSVPELDSYDHRESGPWLRRDQPRPHLRRFPAGGEGRPRNQGGPDQPQRGHGLGQEQDHHVAGEQVGEPDGPFHNFGVLKSFARRYELVHTIRRSTDFEALQLGKGTSGDTRLAFLDWTLILLLRNSGGMLLKKCWKPFFGMDRS